MRIANTIVYALIRLTIPATPTTGNPPCNHKHDPPKSSLLFCVILTNGEIFVGILLLKFYNLGRVIAHENRRKCL